MNTFDGHYANAGRSCTPPPERFTLMRRIRWKCTRQYGETTLCEIQLLHHESEEWLWGIHFSSGNGSGYCFAPLPKWNRSAPSRTEALQGAAKDVRAQIGHASRHEARLIEGWLSEVFAQNYRAAVAALRATAGGEWDFDSAEAW